MTEPIRTIVADDHPLFREGVVRSLCIDPRFQIVAEAGTKKIFVGVTRYAWVASAITARGAPSNETRRAAVGPYTPSGAAALRARTFDREALARRRLPYERLDQLVVELLLGV